MDLFSDDYSLVGQVNTIEVTITSIIQGEEMEVYSFTFTITYKEAYCTSDLQVDPIPA